MDRESTLSWREIGSGGRVLPGMGDYDKVRLGVKEVIVRLAWKAKASLSSGI